MTKTEKKLDLLVLIALAEDPEEREALKDYLRDLIADQPKEPDLTGSIAELLTDIGIPKNMCGYGYLKTAVLYCISQLPKRSKVYADVYPYVAQAHGTTRAKVERGIRTAIETAFSRNDPAEMSELFGRTISKCKGKATNGECIWFVVERIMHDNK